MAFPPFYDPSKVGTLYVPDTAGAIRSGQETKVKACAEDKERVLLLLVDPQVDFIHSDGTLSVPGAVEDTRRTIAWLYCNLERVTDIAASLDSHVPVQIFYPSWWINGEGRHPAAFTAITADEVANGVWRPTVEEEWSVDYVEKLEEQAKKTLMIWPYHTMIGTAGHAITPALYEAIVFHSAARSAEPTFLVKGSIPKTEHYSIFEPEVKVPDEPLGQLNVTFIERLLSYDLVYVAGQAKSHCVLETVTSLVRYAEHAPQESSLLIGKLRLLSDCMSSVAHPEIDFEAMANGQLAKFEAEGLRLVTSGDAVG
jgi:nicotinamidase/pyrazinamidase